MKELTQMSKFVFVGNRRFVLDEMLALNLNICKIYASSGSHLDRQLSQDNINFTSFSTKSELLEQLSEESFDVLISNGCPYILPLDIFLDPASILVNIHPSCLPQLAGRDPVPGAILHNLNAGATCHIIDAGIDTGPILSQLEIPNVDSLDIGLLYQLSFLAEVEVFKQAYANKFAIQCYQPKISDAVYYSRKAEDQLIDFKVDSNELIIAKVRAFGNPSQGVNFLFNEKLYKVFDARIISNEYAIDYAKNIPNACVIFSYDDKIVIKKDGELLQLSGVVNAKEIPQKTSLLEKFS